jgi:hypothetical protein
MGPGMDRLEAGDGDVGISRRRGQVGVPQDLLYVPNVGPAFEQKRRHGMPEDVAAPALPDIRCNDVLTDPLGEPIESEPAAAPGEKQQARIWSTNQAGAASALVPLNPPDGSGTQGDHAVPLSLAGPDNQNPTGRIDIAHSQRSQLGPPDSR